MSCLAQAPHAPIAASCDVMHDVAERHGGLCHVAEQCHSDLHVALTRPDTHSGVAWSTQYLHAGVPQILLASPGSTLCQASVQPWCSQCSAVQPMSHLFGPLLTITCLGNLRCDRSDED